MDQLEKYELKAGQAGVLFVLDNEGTLSQREIAGKMCVKPPSMTVMLQKMEKNGFVTVSYTHLDVYKRQMFF